VEVDLKAVKEVLEVKLLSQVWLHLAKASRLIIKLKELLFST
jgi:hypothetical protein